MPFSTSSVVAAASHDANLERLVVSSGGLAGLVVAASLVDSFSPLGEGPAFDAAPSGANGSHSGAAPRPGRVSEIAPRRARVLVAGQNEPGPVSTSAPGRPGV